MSLLCCMLFNICCPFCIKSECLCCMHSNDVFLIFCKCMHVAFVSFALLLISHIYSLCVDEKEKGGVLRQLLYIDNLVLISKTIEGLGIRSENGGNVWGARL